MCLSETVNDMSAYGQVTDGVLEQVARLDPAQCTTVEDRQLVQEAQTLLRNIYSRRLYPAIGSTQSVQVSFSIYINLLMFIHVTKLLGLVQDLQPPGCSGGIIAPYRLAFSSCIMQHVPSTSLHQYSL